MKRLTPVFLLSTVLAWTWPAHAARVVLFSPASPSAEGTEALNLLRGELLSVGLEVTMEHRPADRDQQGSGSRQWLEALAAGGANAVVDTVEINPGLAVDVWVVKTNPLRFEVTRVAVDPDTPKASEVLSLRAVEALRAGLLLIDRAARKPQPAATPQANLVPADSDLGEQHARWGLDAGAAALASLDGVGLAFLPMLRVSWAIRASLLLQASLVGAGTRPRVAMAGGSVRVAQQYGTLGACYRLRERKRLWPFFALAAGGMHTAVEGRADPDTQGRTLGQWSLVFDGSLGAGLQITRRVYTTLAAHVQWAEPYVVIHSARAVGATSGRPNLILALTVGAWL